MQRKAKKSIRQSTKTSKPKLRPLDDPPRSARIPYDNRPDHAALMRARRAAARVVMIPGPKDINRREKCLSDPERFCRIYWPHIFYNPFARNQKTILDNIVGMIGVGGNSSLAVPRSEGKTNITICVGGIWGAVTGRIFYLVILCGNGQLAVSDLADLKSMYLHSPDFAADFPEVCFPILSLEGSPQRARTQTAKMEDGEFEPELTEITWETNQIVLPRVRLLDGTYAKTSGAIVVAKGADAVIRGLVKNGRRPNMVIGDDLETRESAYSKKQVDDRLRLLKQDIMGLSGPNDPMPIVMLGSIITSGCLMDQLTDREVMPEWGGVRLKRILKYPDRLDLWDKYYELRKTDQKGGDKTCRMAHTFYIENRDQMDEGAETSNPYRFQGIILPDGSQLEISSIQSAMNARCDMGEEGFDAEHQASPHKNEMDDASKLEPILVMRKLNHVPKGFVPNGTDAITIGIDVGARRIHWVAISWKKGLIGNVFDYGTVTVASPTGVSLQNEEHAGDIRKAIFDALMGFRDWELATGWQDHEGGGVRHANMINIDAGYMDVAVYDFLRTANGQSCNAVAGYGSTQRRSYPNPKFRKPGSFKLGSHWWASFLMDKRVWLYHVDSDFWKRQVQTGFMLGGGIDGSLSLYGDNPVVHGVFAKSICAEKWMEEFIPGKGVNRHFYQVSHDNHYLDCVHYAMVAADMLKLGSYEKSHKNKISRGKIKLSDIQKAKRARQRSNL